MSGDAFDDTGLVSRHLDVDLVRFELDERLGSGDRFTRLFQPFHNDRIDN